MGWSSGTELFDRIFDAIPESAFNVEVFKAIIGAFQDMDWDCENESKYFNHPMFQEALRQLKDGA